MLRLTRELRLLPLVLVATGALFILKVTGIVLDGGYTLGERLSTRGQDTLKVAAEAPPETVISGVSQAPSRSWASEVFSYPDITGSVPDAKPAAVSPDLQLKVSAKAPPQEPKPDAAGVMPRLPSPGERAILERLGDRRLEIEARNREIDMRENLLKAAEKRIESRVAELKDMEERINATVRKRDETETTRFKSLVSMYENMKAKDAARIFDRLDMRILVEVASQMNPRRLSDVIAAMTSETAEKLTVELANRAGSQPGQPKREDLPKIEGRPTSG